MVSNYISCMMYLTTVFVFASHLYTYIAYIEHREQYEHDACVSERNIIRIRRTPHT